MSATVCYQALALTIATVTLTAQGKIDPHEHTIDLLSAAPAESADVLHPDRLTLQQPIVVESHAPVKLSPVRILAPQLDRGDYMVGDAFVFEVVFENVGDEPLKFPASRNGQEIHRNMPGAALAAISLGFEDDLLGEQLVGSQFLFGADPVAGSLIPVKPKERVRIRARGKWVVSNPAPPPGRAAWTRPLRLRAAIQLVGNGFVRFIDRSSSTTPAILLRKPPV